LITLIPGTQIETFCNIGCLTADRDRYYEQFGINDPIFLQYSRWIYGLIGSPVIDMGHLPFIHFSEPTFGAQILGGNAFQTLTGGGRGFWSFVVWGSALLVSWLITIPLGIYSATHKDSFSDRLMGFFSYISMSIPSFIVGLTFIYVTIWYFHLILDPFYQIGIGSFLNREYQDQPIDTMVVLNFLWHFVPPVLVIAFSSSAVIFSHTRSKMLDVLDQAFVKTARAKGLRETKVLVHAFRNALTPLIGLLPVWVPVMIEHSLVVALIFGLPMMESAFIGAINSQNMITAMSGVFLYTLILLAANLVSDLFLALSDPRIRYE
jgi:peptide/nickel transport system permease protein